ncbi:DUF6434 domain-containing protein, partial [Acinetobacter baumannii]
WLKEELVNFCKQKKLSYFGSKFDILERLATALDNGFVETQKITGKIPPTSTFNWARSPLTLDTIITDSYTNGPNTRKFFKQ